MCTSFFFFSFYDITLYRNPLNVKITNLGTRQGAGAGFQRFQIKMSPDHILFFYFWTEWS